ncbi:site-specific DNA-methyltransferase [Breznakiella homolactica]|uniref:site-specific DNA-methyltransferase (adenine-specific) n=1 Tax=Breznakiella homolactica TaxID=2798577 RepID=A0A7T8B7J6_9SPIR|nr:site-specific DNA-methyltransferase [Breznakiella homolactica]QQO07579.1 site-specific DNA-methyltransferase [Breznakiella homolactica]
MPTLDWIGKDKVINHHLDVPYRVLERQYSYDESGRHEADNGSENMIIHGDNLAALKSLLPQYEGQVKCIYIDPPYNTGNEGWVYNDNVNDPRIVKWLGEVVGKEGEDLSRHDKWLCMMYPRLKLLQKLLSDDGAIFISIDDTEYANLKTICDEIFGSNCFVSNISWQRTYSTRNDSKGIVNEVEHILVYSNQPNWNPDKLPRTAEMDSKYKNPDNDSVPWTSSDAFAPGAATHQGMVYAIQHPFTGKMIYPSNSACWRYQQDTMLEIMNGWTKYELKDLGDAKERAHVCGIAENEVRTGVMGIVLAEPLEVAAANAKKVLERGQWPRFYFTKNGKGGVRRKTYLDNVGGRLPTNFWPYSETGHTDEAKKEMLAIFNGKATFDTPKPTRLLEFIMRIAGSETAFVLDSFAGSGTTAHAVLRMNKADKEHTGNRKFILIEMMDYADSITAERVKRVINGYGEGNGTVKGTGGSFSFYELGEPLLIGDNLNEAVGEDKIREYVYFTETKCRISAPKQDEPYFLGQYIDTAYYFYYERESITTLNRGFLHSVKTKAGGYVMYADLCTLSASELEKYHITFKKIPRDITKL